jgi:hypothetical protein
MEVLYNFFMKGFIERFRKHQFGNFGKGKRKYKEANKPSRLSLEKLIDF